MALQHFLQQGFAALRRLPLVEVPDYGRGDRGLSMRAGTLVMGVRSSSGRGKSSGDTGKGSGDASDAAIIADLRRAAQQAAGPVGLYVASDGEARWLMRLCEKHGLRIPHEVSVLGTGNHAFPCLRRARVKQRGFPVAYCWPSGGPAYPSPLSRP